MFKKPRNNTKCKLGPTSLVRKHFQFSQDVPEVCKDPHTYLFLDLTLSINDLSRFRTKIFPGETTEVFAPVRGNVPFEVAATLPSR